MNYFIAVFCMLVLMSCKSKKSSQGEDFLNQVDQVSSEIVDDGELLTFFDNPRHPKQTAFQALPTGSNRPTGWILELMQHDLQNGIVGALDELYPGIKEDDLYFTARRGGLEDVPEMGDLVLTGAAWEKSIMWWNAETIGNWWDGFVRHAFLTENMEAIEQSHSIVQNLLNSRDDDGYIGIYKKNLRYQHEGSNGELWAQTTAFRMLLAYYELTGDEKVLEAVERAMALTIKNYGPEGRNPFYLKNAFGGVTHGLMLTDVCETLYRITGNELYRDYGIYLYRAYSTYSINKAFTDVRYSELLYKDSLFQGHGVHTYEHLRSLVNAWYQTGYPELETAYNNAMYKLDFCLLPSGAGHGNEWIAGMKADPTLTSSEFCTMLELRNFYGSSLQKTGSIEFADRAEKLTFNGIMGFRNADGTAIAYGKGDNCYLLDGHHHEKEVSKEDPRYKYSPTHSDPAVCCVPNYTRNFTYFLDQMWMKKEDGLAAVLYGPSLLKTQIKGIDLTIEQITQYPFSDQITFRIKATVPIAFSLYFRKPEWSEELVFNDVSATYSSETGLYRIEKEWNTGDEIQLSFKNKIQIKEFQNGEIYFQRGPLVYAYPISHREETIKSYGLAGFSDYYCFPDNHSFEELKVNEKELSLFKFVDNRDSSNKNLWYSKRNLIEGRMVDGNGDEVQVQLVPMGATVLRKVTFEKIDK